MLANEEFKRADFQDKFCLSMGVGWQTTKYPKVNSIKLNNFSPIASFKPLLHMQAPLDPQTPSQA